VPPLSHRNPLLTVPVPTSPAAKSGEPETTLILLGKESSSATFFWIMPTVFDDSTSSGRIK